MHQQNGVFSIKEIENVPAKHNDCDSPEFMCMLCSGGSTDGGGAEGAVAPPRGEKKFFFIALQQARPAVRRNFIATWNKTNYLSTI